MAGGNLSFFIFEAIYSCGESQDGINFVAKKDRLKITFQKTPLVLRKNECHTLK